MNEKYMLIKVLLYSAYYALYARNCMVNETGARVEEM